MAWLPVAGQLVFDNMNLNETSFFGQRIHVKVLMRKIEGVQITTKNKVSL